MSRFQFVTWDGGGNLPPTLGIARELRDRGHEIRVIGEESQRHAVTSADLSFSPWSHRLASGLAEHPPDRRLTYLIEEVWMNTDLADEVVASSSQGPADVVVVDCMLEGVLARSQEIAAPTAVLVHGLFRSVLPVRDSLVRFGNGLRVDAGLPVLAVSQLKWESKDLVVVTTVREFDGGTKNQPPASDMWAQSYLKQVPPRDGRRLGMEVTRGRSSWSV